MKRYYVLLFACVMLSGACSAGDPSISVCYLLRNNPSMTIWLTNSVARPWSWDASAVGKPPVLRWDAVATGTNAPSAALLESVSVAAIAWWADYQRTRKADLQDEVEKAVVLVILDDRNATAQWLTDFKAAVAAATSLANLQTRVAALPACPQRTPEQIKAAIKEKLAP